MTISIKQYYLKKNPCYIAGKKIKPRGIVVHSTGANNPYLKRYIGPDDGVIGKNQYNNHWNQPRRINMCTRLHRERQERSSKMLSNIALEL